MYRVDIVQVACWPALSGGRRWCSTAAGCGGPSRAGSWTAPCRGTPAAGSQSWWTRPADSPTPPCSHWWSILLWHSLSRSQDSKSIMYFLGTWEVKICTLQNQGLFPLRILCTYNVILSWASHCNALRHFTCLLSLSCGTSYPDQTTQYTATGYRQGHCHQCVASVLSIEYSSAVPSPEVIAPSQEARSVPSPV